MRHASSIPSLPAPRLTRWGWWLLVSRIIAPVVLALCLLDGLIYLVMRYGFGICYGVWCWL